MRWINWIRISDLSESQRVSIYVGYESRIVCIRFKIKTHLVPMAYLYELCIQLSMKKHTLYFTEEIVSHFHHVFGCELWPKVKCPFFRRISNACNSFFFEKKSQLFLFFPPKIHSCKWSKNLLKNKVPVIRAITCVKWSVE